MPKSREPTGLGCLAASALAALGCDRRGGIAVLTALVGPLLVMFAGVGMEITAWVAIQGGLQRTADVAAHAGGLVYFTRGSARDAANAAADAAELNGAAGAVTRGWNATTQTLTDGQITVQIGAGVRDGRDTGITVTLARAVPLGLTRVMSANPSITLRASGTADVAGQQPCLLALKPSGAAGGTGIGSSGSSGISLRSCPMVSNASISTGGSSSISASAFYAHGTTSGSLTGGPLYPGSPAAVDPYATYAPVQDAFARLGSGQGPAFGATSTMYPGTYSGGSVQGSVVLKPGLYYVNGTINVGSSDSLTDSGVTIISSGNLNTSGQANIKLSAPLQGDTSGGIAGVVYASTSTGTSGVGGGVSAILAGVVYYPNGTLNFTGHASAGQTCLGIVAGAIGLGGGSDLAMSGCDLYGGRPFGRTGADPVALTR